MQREYNISQRSHVKYFIIAIITLLLDIFHVLHLQQPSYSENLTSPDKLSTNMYMYYHDFSPADEDSAHAIIAECVKKIKAWLI